MQRALLIFFFTTTHFKIKLLNNYKLDWLEIKNRNRLIANKWYYKLVYTLLKNNL
jgi:hypothetical protein